MINLLAPWLVNLLFLAATPTSANATTIGGVTPGYQASPAGLMSDERLIELSGLAPSRRVKNHFWAINDSGQSSSLWEIDNNGKIVREVQLPDVANIDFEDLTSFVWNGRFYLAIADIGDNKAETNEHRIYVLREPKLGASKAKITWTVRYRYPDRGHDAESLMVDTRAKLFYIVNKRVEPPMLFSVPMRSQRSGKNPELVTATAIALLEHLQMPDISEEVVLDPKVVNQTRYASQPTSAVMSCDRTQFYLLTYAAIYRFERQAKQSWAQALPGQQPLRIQLPPIYQAEAITLTPDCSSLFVGSEKLPSVLWKFKIDPAVANAP